ncbi:hypothetical protein GCM10018966_006280 [Streptomyces yanii]
MMTACATPSALSDCHEHLCLIRRSGAADAALVGTGSERPSLRQGEPGGTAQVDIGQACASTRLKSSLVIRKRFMREFQTFSGLQQPKKHEKPCMIGCGGCVS